MLMRDLQLPLMNNLWVNKKKSFTRKPDCCIDQTRVQRLAPNCFPPQFPPIVCCSLSHNIYEG